MTCPKCGSDKVTVQLVSETQITPQHHSAIWWICVGWWWLFFKWIFLTLPALIVKLFKGKKTKTTTIHKSMCICQNCGHTWEADQ